MTMQSYAQRRRLRARRPATSTAFRGRLSYWEDAWRRLKQNPRAIASLWIVLFLLAFSILGPVVWRVDSSAQNLDQISRPPTLGAEAVLVQAGVRWDFPVDASVPQGPDAAWFDRPRFPNSLRRRTFAWRRPAPGPSTGWDAVPNAASCTVAWNGWATLNELGLPLGATLGGNELGFEDALDLSEGAYWYSVTASDGLTESASFATVRADVELAVSIENALRRGYVSEADAPEAGDRITLGAHPLGTDYLGRDMLARLMHGAQTSLFIGIVAPLLYVLLGTAWGQSRAAGGRTAPCSCAWPTSWWPALLLFMILFVASGVEAGESGIGDPGGHGGVARPATALVRGSCNSKKATCRRRSSARQPRLRHMFEHPRRSGDLTFAIPTRSSPRRSCRSSAWAWRHRPRAGGPCASRA